MGLFCVGFACSSFTCMSSLGATASSDDPQTYILYQLLVVNLVHLMELGYSEPLTKMIRGVFQKAGYVKTQ